MQKLNENISKQDIFTPALDLNYNGDDTTKSVTGGFCWILIKIFMLAYAAANVLRIIYNQSNLQTSYL
jgi:hypothetical protein